MTAGTALSRSPTDGFSAFVADVGAPLRQALIAAYGPNVGPDATATGQPGKHWSLSELPVAVNLGTGRTHYFRGRSAWGALFFSNLRAIAADYIEGDG
ncbi:MAG: hypothetical protein V3W36_04890 [Acidimicrobiia bacterium]